MLIYLNQIEISCPVFCDMFFKRMNLDACLGNSGKCCIEKSLTSPSSARNVCSLNWKTGGDVFSSYDSGEH